MSVKVWDEVESGGLRSVRRRRCIGDNIVKFFPADPPSDMSVTKINH